MGKNDQKSVENGSKSLGNPKNGGYFIDFRKFLKKKEPKSSRFFRFFRFSRPPPRDFCKIGVKIDSKGPSRRRFC